MKFSTREDVNAPADVVFAEATDFDGFERMIRRYGSKVTRMDDQNSKGAGMMWDVGFKFRGRNRHARATVTEFTTPDSMGVSTEVGGMDSLLSVEVIALSATKSRLQVSLELKPKTLSARLIVQSLKLAKTKMNTRFKARVSSFAANIEDSFRQAA
ncbi:MAG: SRPBCC family protein [Pseudomonadota bacterium]